MGLWETPNQARGGLFFLDDLTASMHSFLFYNSHKLGCENISHPLKILFFVISLRKKLNLAHCYWANSYYFVVIYALTIAVNAIMSTSYFSSLRIELGVLFLSKSYCESRNINGIFLTMQYHVRNNCRNYRTLVMIALQLFCQFPLSLETYLHCIHKIIIRSYYFE